MLAKVVNTLENQINNKKRKQTNFQTNKGAEKRTEK